MKSHPLLLITLLFIFAGCSVNQNKKPEGIRFAEIKDVKIKDPFWSPKLELWSKVTANDVLNKFEGKHLHDKVSQNENNTFHNFDRVALGEIGTNKHAGLPWFDGLIYETIRGISDFLIEYPDKHLEERVDGYIDRIDAAQKTDPQGYIATYTQLVEPEHRWGENGGFLRFQHDVYNAGMLIEAGIHYYQATGKTKLLNVATRLANHMCEYMGPSPKKNIVPSHSGPEEPMIKLYWLYKNNPQLKKQMDIPVHEDNYWNLATFWIENRGSHCGYPLWAAWGNEKSEQWIKDGKYLDAQFGPHSRPSWGDYAQDSISVFKQKTIEGHAVRATLLATGIATAALENHSEQYIRTVKDLWENMTGRRMFITGGVGAIHFDEKFGPDYFLPTDAYLETCAAVGAGFFSQRMNQLTGEGKYMDEFERVLYNNVLTGISLSGTNYTYQNPLNATHHERWAWHSCPCCPPMFLKITSALPGYIYSYEGNNIFVNLFIGSDARIKLNDGSMFRLKQETRYPWDGKVVVSLEPEKPGEYTLNIRIPGWAQGKENPDNLYYSNLDAPLSLQINDQQAEINISNGYAVIKREWNKGDKIELILPMQPRIIEANQAVSDLKNKVALASGPVIYCLEESDNTDLPNIEFDKNSSLEISYDEHLLDGINTIKSRNGTSLTAIPYFAAGNREQGKGYCVWIPKKSNKQENSEYNPERDTGLSKKSKLN